MKALLKSTVLTLVVIGSIVLFYGCEKNPTEPEDTVDTELSDTEQMEIIAAEVSENDGGIMADLKMASTCATNSPGSLPKTAGYDTTFTHSWITFSVSVSFYDSNGVEQDHFYDGKTDRIVYQSAATGRYAPADSLQEIQLNRNTNFDMTGITTGKIIFNGSSVNSSEYGFSSVRINLDAKSQSTFTIENLVIDRNSSTYLPESGRLRATVKGTYNKESLRSIKDIEYKIDFTIEFNGGNEVKITLASGTTFTLNIVTGEIIE